MVSTFNFMNGRTDLNIVKTITVINNSLCSHFLFSETKLRDTRFTHHRYIILPETSAVVVKYVKKWFRISADVPTVMTQGVVF
jgi:hypothetical protein